MISIIEIINGNRLSISYRKSIMDSQKKDCRSAVLKYHQKLIFWISYKDKKRKFQDPHIINLIYLQGHYLEKWINFQEKLLLKL
jgi:hypothetical protein